MRAILLDLRLLGGGREESVTAVDEDRVGIKTADCEDGDELRGGEMGLGFEVRVFWGY